MRQRSLWSGGFGRWLPALGLLGVAGCLGCLHPVEPPPPQIKAGCQTAPRCCRDHVYIFLMNGLDLLNSGNLTGLRDYVLALGFSRTYYGQMVHVWWFETEIRRIHREDPDARFVLVGHSLGSNVVQALAEAVQADGIEINLVVFLSGNQLVRSLPGLGSVGQPGGAGDEPLHLPSALHFGAPSDPATLQMLARELTVMAGTVPVPGPAEESRPQESEEAPPPRPVKSRSTVRRGEWDFLQPVTTPRTSTLPPPSGLH